MGTFVEFWHGSEDGLLGHFLAGPLAAFRIWCINASSEDPDWVKPAILPLLDAVLSRGAFALDVASEVEAKLCDDLLNTYYGGFIACQRHDLLEPANDSLLPVSLYRSVHAALEPAPNKKSETLLWSYLLNGRAVFRDSLALPYQSSDNCFWLSYWTAMEVDLLLPTFTNPLPTWLLCADRDALRNTEMALSSAAARRTGLIITVA